VEQARDAVSPGPSAAATPTERGRAYLRQGDADKALQELNQAVQRNPSDARAHALRARCHLLQKDPGQAMLDAEEAIRLDPKSAEGYASRGAVWLQRGDAGRAVQDCTVALSHDPNLTVAYLTRAVAALLSNQKLDQAIKDCDAAIQLEPKSAYAYTLRGTLHQKRGADQETLRDWEKAIEIAPRNADVRAALGREYAGWSDHEKVIEHLGEALKLKAWPAREEAQLRNLLSYAYLRHGSLQSERGNRQLAILIWTEGLRHDPRRRTSITS
jgi:tetratricopeptide (TPR) repeat protein